MLADIVDGLGLPAGAFNLVSGRGALVGDLLSSHPEVDMVSLTGSTGAGVQVARSAAGTIKKVALELGGKSAFLLAEGADMDAAMSAAVRGCFVNNGQTCSATTRLIVPRSLLAEVEERVAAAVNAYVVGDPLDPTTEIGPVASAGQFRTVTKYIEIGMSEGTLIAGGPGPVEGLDRGYFVKPTVFSRLDPGATVVQEEIFGPVLAIVAYDDGIEQGIAIANDSEFGLSGAVFAADIPEAVADRQAPAHRPGRRQRRPVQCEGPVRRVQDLGRRARARAPRPHGVLRAAEPAVPVGRRPGLVRADRLDGDSGGARLAEPCEILLVRHAVPAARRHAGSRASARTGSPSPRRWSTTSGRSASTSSTPAT